MTGDIIEQAIVATQKALDCNLGEYDSYSGGGTACFEHETDLNDKGNCPVASVLTQALDDTGLLARPLPTRDEIADAIYDALSGQYGDFCTPYDAAEAVLELLKGQDR